MQTRLGIDLRPLFGSTLLVVAAAYGLLLYLASRAGLFGILLALPGGWPPGVVTWMAPSKKKAARELVRARRSRQQGG